MYNEQLGGNSERLVMGNNESGIPTMNTKIKKVLLPELRTTNDERRITGRKNTRLQGVKNRKKAHIMKSILEALFEGELSPAEMITPETTEYHQVNSEIVNLTETWKRKLSEDDYQSFEELLELINKSNMMEAAASFSYGFKLCATLLLEVVADRGELVRRG
jgi:hypothetical protein